MRTELLYAAALGFPTASNGESSSGTFRNIIKHGEQRERAVRRK